MYEVMYCDRLREAQSECYALRCNVSRETQLLCCADNVERQIIEVIGVLDAGLGFILPDSDNFVKNGTRYGILVKVKC